MMNIGVNMRKKPGFTLAEVLITLGIIGIIAAITIPILMANYQKQQYIVELKKAYSEFNQAIKSLSADQNCGGDLICTGLFPGGFDSTTFGNEIVKYFKVVKNCKNSVSCMIPGSLLINQAYDGSSTPDNYAASVSSNPYIFQTLDGMLFMIFGENNSECNNSWGSGDDISHVCAEVIIDINGIKGPNYFGRDIFDFYITNGKRGPLLYPCGGLGDDADTWRIANNTCTTSTPSQAWDCTSRIMAENWQMNY